MLHYSNHLQPQLTMLSEQQIHDIHLATLEVLDRVGVEVLELRALELLRQAGARVEGTRAHLPAFLVEQAIRTAPERVMMAARTGERVMPLERDRVFFGTGSDTPFTIDLETRERRPSHRADVTQFARLCDALPEMDFVMSMGIASDAPEKASFVFEFPDMMAGTTKPIVFTAFDVEDMEDIYEMAVAVAGSESALQANPFLLQYAEPISPLQHSPVGCRKLLFCADHRIPVVYVSGTGAGGTTPAALGSAIVVASAECLSGLVIHQLASPGAPFVYGANISAIDMRTMNFTYGGPEHPITNAALADLARHYRLPAWGLAGATDAMAVDAQAGLEAMMHLSMAVYSRGNLVHDVGYIESGLTSSLEMVTMCNEIIGMVRMIARGIPTDADHLDLDTIAEVGPGGHFLATEHTARFFRTEHFVPQVLNRYTIGKWEEMGRKTLADRLNDRVREILAAHTPTPTPDAAQETIAKVLRRAAARA